VAWGGSHADVIGKDQAGFSRIGIALAMVFAIAAAIGVAVVGVDRWRTIGQGYEQAQCVADYERHVAVAERGPWTGYQVPKANPFDQFDNAPAGGAIPPLPPGYDLVAATIGCPGPSYSLSFERAGRLVSEGLAAPYLKAAAWTAAGVLGVAAIALCIWLAFYGLGWTVAGFARD
jgi:hypothetical protein